MNKFVQPVAQAILCSHATTTALRTRHLHQHGRDHRRRQSCLLLVCLLYLWCQRVLAVRRLFPATVLSATIVPAILAVSEDIVPPAPATLGP